MKVIYAILLLFVFCFCQVRAQSIEIDTYYKPCLGTVGKIPLKLTGNFNTDNVFFVQLRAYSASEILAQVNGVVNQNGELEFMFTDSSLTTYRELQVRVVSSSPRVESWWVNLYKVNGKGTVHLSSSAYSDTINAGEEIKLKFTTVSSSDVSLTLSDGSVIQLDYPYELEKISPSQTESIYIKNASNACGVVKTSGSVDVVVNQNPVRTIWAAPAKVCEDGEVTIGFSSYGLSLTPQSKFRIRFVQITDYGVIPKVVIVDAVLRDSILFARFPKSLILSEETRFHAQVLIDAPKIVGNDGNIVVSVTPFPKVGGISVFPSTEIKMGEGVSLGYSSDIYYGNFEVDGVPYITGGNSAFISNRNYLNPEKTSTFVLKSIETACGTTIPSERKEITIQVKPGIVIEPESSRQILCVGATSRIRFRTNTELLPSTTFSVNVMLYNHFTYSFAATRVGNYLEFIIPPLSGNTSQDLLYDRITNVQVVASNPTIESLWSSNFVIQGKPWMELDSRNVYNIETPSEVFVGYYLYGGGYYSIENDRGEVFIHDNSSYNNSWYRNIFIPADTDFKMKSISNSCFTNENTPTAHFKVANNPNPILRIEEFKSKYGCITDSIEIDFKNYGVFGAENVFNIQYSYGCCDFKNIAIVPGNGVYKIRVPDPPSMESHDVFVRVVSSNPSLISNVIGINLHGSPSVLMGASIIDPGTQLEPKRFSDSLPVFKIDTQGYPISKVTYSSRGKDTTVTLYYPQVSPSIYPMLNPGEITGFTIKSLTNFCGSQEVNLSTYLKLKPYRVFLRSASNFCRGGAVNVQFYTDPGTVKPGVTFSLQIAASGNANYRTIASGETKNYFSTHLPSDLSPGEYVVRAISSDGAESDELSVYVKEFPTAKLSTTVPQPVILDPETPLECKIDFTGDSPWTPVFSNNRLFQYYNSPGGYAPYFDARTEFSLDYVYNVCGYGTTSGKVNVQVTSKLYTSILKAEACEERNFEFGYELKGDADLSNDFIRFELVNLKNNKIVVLDSTKSRKSSVVVAIPKLQPNDSYELRATLRSYGLTSHIISTLKTRPNVSLSGYSIINPGERASLILKNNKDNYDNIAYVLSDGTTGSVIMNNYGESFIQVIPSLTTNYTLVSVSNDCGFGQISGSAVVEVNSPSEKTVTATNLSPNKTTYCFGDSIQVYYTQKGNFSAGNIMTIQISDTTGKIYRSIPTRGNTSPLKSALPTDLEIGKKYYLRVVASDQGVASGSYRFPIMLVRKPSARFASSTVYFEENPEIIVLLEGGGPWNYSFVTDGIIYPRTAYNSTDIIKLPQTASHQNYSLLGVSNQCGVGTIGSPSTVAVELQLITGNPEDLGLKVIVAPNPTSDFVALKFNTTLNRKIELITIQGSVVDSKDSRLSEHSINVQGLPAGLYIIRIKENEKTVSYKLIKQ